MTDLLLITFWFIDYIRYSFLIFAFWVDIDDVICETTHNRSLVSIKLLFTKEKTNIIIRKIHVKHWLSGFLSFWKTCKFNMTRGKKEKLDFWKSQYAFNQQKKMIDDSTNENNFNFEFVLFKYAFSIMILQHNWGFTMRFWFFSDENRFLRSSYAV